MCGIDVWVLPLCVVANCAELRLTIDDLYAVSVDEKKFVPWGAAR